MPDKSLGTWHNIEERDNDWIFIQVMIIYIGYVKFRDYEYLCWVRSGTNFSYEYDNE